MGRDGLLIGEVAARTGVSHKALRLYEEAGILPAPRRTAAGYRIYGQETVALLAFITQARRLGFRLDEIKEIVQIKRSGRVPCPHVLDLVRQKVGVRIGEAVVGVPAFSAYPQDPRFSEDREVLGEVSLGDSEAGQEGPIGDLSRPDLVKDSKADCAGQDLGNLGLQLSLLFPFAPTLTGSGNLLLCEGVKFADGDLSEGDDR